MSFETQIKKFSDVLTHIKTDDLIIENTTSNEWSISVPNQWCYVSFKIHFISKSQCEFVFDARLKEWMPKLRLSDFKAFDSPLIYCKFNGPIEDGLKIVEVCTIPITDALNSYEPEPHITSNENPVFYRLKMSSGYKMELEITSNRVSKCVRVISPDPGVQRFEQTSLLGRDAIILLNILIETQATGWDVNEINPLLRQTSNLIYHYRWTRFYNNSVEIS